MTFLKFLKHRKKDGDTLAVRAKEILELGKPTVRGAGLPEWRVHLKGEGASLGLKRALTKLYQEYEDAYG